MKHIIIILTCGILAACSSVPETSVPLRPDVLYFLDTAGGRAAAAEVTRLYDGKQEVAIVNQRMPKIYPPVERAETLPKYPQELRSKKVSGEVVVDYVVSETGEVLYAAIAESQDSRLNAAAIDAVLQWRYQPATRGGRPVRCQLQAPITFGPGS